MSALFKFAGSRRGSAKQLDGAGAAGGDVETGGGDGVKVPMKNLGGKLSDVVYVTSVCWAPCFLKIILIRVIFRVIFFIILIHVFFRVIFVIILIRACQM